MYKFLVVFTLFLAHRGWAQDTTGVIVNKDPRVDQLVRKQIAINEETTRESRRNVPGFRVQVINTRDRTQAYDAKTKIYQQFPDWQPYLMYQAPYYKLRVGDFKTQDEADAALQQLQKIFPSGIYVIRDIIELKLSDMQTPSNP